MTKDRYQLLMESDVERLTPEEIDEGYHFCYEWDGLLIHPDDPEYGYCSCSGVKPEHRARGKAVLEKEMKEMEGMYDPA